MKLLLSLIFPLFFSASAFAGPLKLSDLKKVFAENGLDKYIVSGQAVQKFFDDEFKTVANPSVMDGGFSAEYFDLDYEAHLRPNMPEPYVSLTVLTQDTNNLLKLHKTYYSKIKGRVTLRNYFQTAFIGLVHTIESLRKVHVGAYAGSYSVLTTLILEQGRLITSSQNDYVTMTDFWWDFMWARFLNFPADLVELGNQKLRGVWLNEKTDLRKKEIEKFLAGYSMLALRKATNPVVYRDITNQIMVRLAKNAHEIFTLRQDQRAMTKSRIFKYKYETKIGLTEDAERTKREIAKEGLKLRFKRIWYGSQESFSTENENFFFRLFKAAMAFIYNIYSLARYFIGFLLITFPFDAAFIIAGLIILSIEGRALFNKDYWPRYEFNRSQRWWMNAFHSILRLINNAVARVANDLFYGFRMLFYYYTSDQTNRNIRIGSSLLIFGMGLFFSSARTIVESFVAQMSL